MAVVPRRFTIGREITALEEALRLGRVLLTREGRDDAVEWIDVSLTPNWSNVGDPFYPMQYVRHPLEQVLILRGMCQAGIGPSSGEVLFTLPVGYRPAYPISFGAYVFTAFEQQAKEVFQVQPNGNVITFMDGASHGTPSQVSFDGFEFPLPDDPGPPV